MSHFMLGRRMGVKSAVQFLIALFIVLTMVIPTGLAAADESFIVFTGDREEYKYSDPLPTREPTRRAASML